METFGLKYEQRMWDKHIYIESVEFVCSLRALISTQLQQSTEQRYECQHVSKAEKERFLLDVLPSCC